MGAIVSITVSGARTSACLEALVDTGFNGDLCLPLETAVVLGLELRGYHNVQYADGRVEEELRFRGEVQLLGHTQRANIMLTKSDEALLGMGLLKGHTLFIDCDTDEVRIERKPHDEG